LQAGSGRAGSQQRHQCSPILLHLAPHDGRGGVQGKNSADLQEGKGIRAGFRYDRGFPCNSLRRRGTVSRAQLRLPTLAPGSLGNARDSDCAYQPRSPAALLGCVWNGPRIAAIGGKAVILRRLAGRGSSVRRIRRVRCEQVCWVVRLLRRWGRCIHIDAFAVDPRSRRVLRGRDHHAQKQRCQSERKVPNPVHPPV
jgi:hypothetical protein